MTPERLDASPLNTSSQELNTRPEEPNNACSDRTCIIAIEVFEFMKNAAFHAALIVIKVIIIPIELSLTGVALILTIPACLFSRTLQTTPRANEEANLFHHACALVKELWEVTLITILFGIASKEEQLQYVDPSDDNGPQYVHIAPKTPKTNVAPILYAPGYLDEPDTLRRSCRRIANETGAHVYIVKYQSKFNSIEEHTEDLSHLAQKVFQEHGQELILIGHSMGGLVTGNFIAKANEEAKRNIKLWVTIASPMKGTIIAMLGISDCAHDMRPDSPFITNFNNEDRSSTPSLHIYTKTDLVVPFESAISNDPTKENFLTVESSGHMSVRANRSVEERIAQRVNEVNQSQEDV